MSRTLAALVLTLVVAGCRANAVSPRACHDPPIAAGGLEVVAALGAVLGNVAVSPRGRIFITYHPEGAPAVKDSQLNRVLFHSRRAIAKLGPHYLYRFRALAEGQPGR